MNLFLKISFFFMSLFVFAGMAAQTNASGQDYFESTIEEKKFDEQKWLELVKDFDYSERIFEDYDEDLEPLPDQNAKKNASQPGSDGTFGAFLAKVFQVLFIVVVVASIVMLLINLLGAGDIFGPRNRKIQNASLDFSIEKIESDFRETDLDKFIRQAIDEKNYALAVRLYYLAIIKELSLSNIIKWKRDKTNESYLRETRETRFFEPFREVTRLFEKIWYGPEKLDEQQFLSIKPKFESLIKLTRSDHSVVKID